MDKINNGTVERIIVALEEKGIKIDGLKECELGIAIENILVGHNKAVLKLDKERVGS